VSWARFGRLVLCIVKIFIVYRLFRDEKSPIPRLRPVSPLYPTTGFLLISQGVSVLVTEPFQSSCLIFHLEHTSLSLLHRRARGSTPRIGNCFQWNFFVFFGKDSWGLKSSTPPLKELQKSLYMTHLLYLDVSQWNYQVSC
jgi:hypothetical protein